MIVEFDLIMQDHIYQIKDDQIHNHYLMHNIQNELLNLLASKIKIKIIKEIKDAKYYSNNTNINLTKITTLNLS